MSPRALASPASLKGSLSAAEAAQALGEGFAAAGVDADAMPIADGGEGTVDALCSDFEQVETVDAFGRPRIARTGVLPDGTRVVEAAEAIPLDPSRLDVTAASSRGLGLWLGRYRDSPLVVTVGGTATMDAGAGLLEVLDCLAGPVRVLCDVRTTLYDAPRLFGPQKGATEAQVADLEARFRADERLAPFACLPGSGAAGGLGAALAALGAELVPGAEAVLDLAGFDPGGYDLVVTGEGAVDATTWEGKAPSAAARRCADAGIACVVFGGSVTGAVPARLRPQTELVALSGDPSRARADLADLGEKLGRRLAVLGAA
ncbi:MAG: glycerate kinase [Verrucomicrobiota bacterium]